MQNLESIKEAALARLDDAGSSLDVESLRIEYLGKSGVITALLKNLGQVAPESRKELGAAYNKLKEEISASLDAKKALLETTELNAKLLEEWRDATLPPRPEGAAERLGSLHPISRVISELVEIFSQIGFSVADGPEIEDDYHNFTALNFPEGHPAREMHDTFYLPARKDAKNGEDGKGGGKILLRTHTSTVQVRTMMSGKPPFRVISPGKTYRSDSDMTHTPMFHQIEGLVIDKEINMGHLKGVISDFIARFFGRENIPMRFRSSFFPFTEPSAEVDIGCSRKDGVVKIGEGDDWLEILGCGMVHPNVLSSCGINPDEWQGFAFGMGIERLAMLKYGMPDLRAFFESDIRWLKHYGFHPFG